MNRAARNVHFRLKKRNAFPNGSWKAGRGVLASQRHGRRETLLGRVDVKARRTAFGQQVRRSIPPDMLKGVELVCDARDGGCNDGAVQRDAEEGDEKRE